MGTASIDFGHTYTPAQWKGFTACVIAAGHLAPASSGAGLITPASIADIQSCATGQGIVLTMYAPENFIGQPLEAFITRVDATSKGIAQLPGDLIDAAVAGLERVGLLVAILALAVFGVHLLFRGEGK